MKQKALIFSSILIFFFLPDCQAQEPDSQESKERRLGLMLGYGDQNYLKYKYSYEVSLFQLQYSTSLKARENWSFELLIQPQYNRSRYLRRDDNAVVRSFRGYELGCNVGVLIRRKLLKDRMSVYLGLSAGPHYISGSPRRQAVGFLFSDNLLLGFDLKVFRSLYLDIRPTYRHISNAGIRRPNRGINSLLINGGLYLKL